MGIPVVTVYSYNNQISPGERGQVQVNVAATRSRKIVSIQADLIGDGEPGWTVESPDARNVAGIWYGPTRFGSFNLVITAIDSLGCIGSTGLRRDVVVK